MQEYDIPPFDLVIVDLYPFEETMAKTEDASQIIEKIDIGGISLIRAGAKNFNDVLIVPSQKYYGELIHLLENQHGETSIDDRRRFAAYAFGVSSHYDSAIMNWFTKDDDNKPLRICEEEGTTLRYGENPHQKGSFYGNMDAMFEKLHGKELSYNNLLDLDAGLNLIREFDEPTFAILKHNNPCGIACRKTVKEAYLAALAGDPVSAFGGVLIANAPIDKVTAEEINKIFFEVIIAPDYDLDALEILGQKKNSIILIRKEQNLPVKLVRSALNGVLVQEKDTKVETPDDLKLVTSRNPSDDEIEDMLFANKIVKNSKSNSIVFARGKQLLASGVGQTSRVDALKQAVEKAHGFGFSLEGAAMASDAFFPFPDCVELADQAGVKNVIHPGGSVRDQESIDYCEQHDMTMVITGFRHFKH